MKKRELSALLTVSSHVKTLAINGAFRVTATPVSAYNEPVTVFKSATPVKMSLSLEYTLKHDKAYGKYLPLTARTPDELQTEIARKMRKILTEIADDMEKAWNNGYIQGQVIEDE